MLLAGIFFTIMITAVKIAREELSAFSIIFWRSLVGVLFTLALLRSQVRWPSRPALVALRALLGFAGMACVFTSARGLSIGDLSVLHKLQPLIVGAMAPWFLGVGERPGRVWGALLAGFAGALLVIGPDLSIGNWYGMWAVLGAFFSAAAHVTIRSLGRDHDPGTVVLWFQALGIPCAFGAQWLSERAMPLPSATTWALIVLIAFCATAGQFCMTTAYKLDKAARIAAISYAAPLWGFLADVVVFGASPRRAAVLGGSLVVGAGLWLVFTKDDGKADLASKGPESA